jgi:branched-chain amino acid transport system ATP-binding protein
MSEALLEVEALETGYGEVQVVWGLSLKASPGRFTTLVGANGAGKTTTLKALVGTLAPWSGRVLFKGEDVTRLPAHAKAARGLVLVPEGRQLFSNMTVGENLEMGAFTKRGTDGYAARIERTFTLFPRLKERHAQKAGTLSGGEQQMLAIARGLMAEPEILIIDEVSLGLAPIFVYQLFSALKVLKDDGLTVLLVEQNVHLAFSVCDYAYVIAEGRIFTEGAPHALAAMPEIRRAYLGR